MHCVVDWMHGYYCCIITINFLPNELYSRTVLHCTYLVPSICAVQRHQSCAFQWRTHNRSPCQTRLKLIEPTHVFFPALVLYPWVKYGLKLIVPMGTNQGNRAVFKMGVVIKSSGKVKCEQHFAVQRLWRLLQSLQADSRSAGTSVLTQAFVASTLFAMPRFSWECTGAGCRAHLIIFQSASHFCW